MKVPKTFIPKKVKEIDPDKVKLPTFDLEELILRNINGMSCDEKMISKLVNSYSSGELFRNLGIKTESVKKIALANYNRYFNRVILLEYKTEQRFFENLKELCEEGTKYYANKPGDKTPFNERFLFKNKISIYLEGNENFIAVAFHYYKKLGFEKLEE